VRWRRTASGDGVRLAGRILSIRSHGRTVFADLADRDGRLQLYLRANDLGESFAVIELLDIGDWIGVEGELFRTRMGEVTLRVADLAAAGEVRAAPAFGKEEVDEATGERRVSTAASPTSSSATASGTRTSP
jgi:lysyl-tRNA synthetase class II